MFDTRPPRGALAVIAVGLLATIAAALLSTDKSRGSAANLEWVDSASIPDSPPVPLGGPRGSMRIVDAEISATGTNFSGYALFRVYAELHIDAGSPVGDGRVLCETNGGQGAEIARSSGGLRALYPRSSDNGIFGQAVPEVLLMDFSARGGQLVVVDAEDLAVRRFTTERGVKLEWPEYREGRERLSYLLAGGSPERDLVLPFYTVWRTTAVPAARIACTVGGATARTGGSLGERTPPIDEEAEDRAEEEAEAEAEEAEEDEEVDEGE